MGDRLKTRIPWTYLQWSALAVVFLLGIIWEFYPLPDASERLSRLPLSGPGYSGYEVPITDVERSVFKDNRLLKRIYQVGNQQFFLSIVDGTHHRSSVHDPTLCFQGSGWSIAGRKHISLFNGSGEILFLKRGEETQEVLLWFSDGQERHASLVRYWYQTALRRLSLGKSGAEPVRIIVQPVRTDKLDWDKLLQDFFPLWVI